MNISRAAKVTDRIEIRLTGLDKGNSEDLYVAIRNASGGRSPHEASSLPPPSSWCHHRPSGRWAVP